MSTLKYTQLILSSERTHKLGGLLFHGVIVVADASSHAVVDHCEGNGHAHLVLLLQYTVWPIHIHSK